MKHLFLNGQSELHSCPCQCCSIRAAWPAELIWTVNHRLIHRSNSPEWIIHAHEKLLIFEMFSHWMNQQANSISNQDSFLCVSLCVTYASLTVSVHTHSPSNNTPATTLQAIITFGCVCAEILNLVPVTIYHSSGSFYWIVKQLLKEQDCICIVYFIVK